MTMPQGAQSVRFSAWGRTGTDAVIFSAGIEDIDGFSVETTAITLGNTPTEYAMDLRGARDSKVVGAFSWAMASSDVPPHFLYR